MPDAVDMPTRAAPGPILAERLRARQGEIEEAALSRIAKATDMEVDDGVYPYGLQCVVRSALRYGYEALERPRGEVERAPVQLLEAARKEARQNTPLDVILRGYLAGQALLADYVADEAGKDESIQGLELHRVLRSLPLYAGHLLEEVSAEYTQEQRKRSALSNRGRLASEVRRMLSGSPLDTSTVNYDFGLIHTAAVAVGADAAEVLRAVAAAGGHRLLLVAGDDDGVWAWLGSRQPLSPRKLGELSQPELPAEIRVAFGESVGGSYGWRLTHQQAKAALPFALRSSDRVVQYADVALPATMLRDRVLFSSVQRRYLAPLADEHDGGVALRATLRAYWGASRNMSSAAATLGVNRHTVARRLRALEERFGQNLPACEAEIAAALKLEELGLQVLRTQ